MEVDGLARPLHGCVVARVNAAQQPFQKLPVGEAVAAAGIPGGAVIAVTTTSVASCEARGTGSHAARNGGSNGCL